MTLHSVTLIWSVVFFCSGLLQQSSANNQHSSFISPPLASSSSSSSSKPLKSSREQPPKLIVFSFDGFRNDYVNPQDTPFLYKYAINGVRGHMIPTMVTKTYPNHQSIVTGLYEPYHGIVNNKFIDPLKNESFDVNLPSTFWWDQNNISVPLYIANEFYDEHRASGSMQWPGGWAFYTDGKNNKNGVINERKRVHYLQNYDKDMDWNKRIDTVIQWLTNPNRPADVVFIYFDEPDSTSHKYGPFSKQVKEQIKRIDDMVGYFQARLIEAELVYKSNIIFLSDHGMSEIKNNTDNIFHLIDCEKLYPGMKYEIHGRSPNWSLIPLEKPKNNDTNKEFPVDLVIRDSLNECSRKLFNGKFKVYRQEDVPKEWHYSGNRRILGLVLISDDGTDVFYDQAWNPPGDPIWGNHGYNNTLPSMRPLFIASGRAFKQSFVHPTVFENVDLYPMMLNLLGIPISAFPSNGSFARVREMLDKRLYLSDEDYIKAHSIGDEDNTMGQLFLVFLYLGIGFGIIVTIGLCFVFTTGFSKETSSQRRSRLEKDNSLMSTFFKRFQPKTSHYGSDYRMFYRPTSHLDSSFEEEDDHSNDGEGKRNQKRSNQRRLTDIDWDIVGTGLDIDLAGELNPTGRNIDRGHGNDERDRGRQVTLSIEESSSDSDDLELATHEILSRHDLSRTNERTDKRRMTNDTKNDTKKDTLIDI